MTKIEHNKDVIHKAHNVRYITTPLHAGGFGLWQIYGVYRAGYITMVQELLQRYKNCYRGTGIVAEVQRNS